MIYSLIILAMFLLSITADAYSDVYYRKHSKINHWAQAYSIMFLSIGFLTFSVETSQYDTFNFWLSVLGAIKIGAGYVALRMATFNLMYNNMIGLDFDYVGETDDIFDKPLSYLPDWSIPIAYIICGFIGLVLIFS